MKWIKYELYVLGTKNKRKIQHSLQLGQPSMLAFTLRKINSQLPLIYPKGYRFHQKYFNIDYLSYISNMTEDGK